MASYSKCSKPINFFASLLFYIILVLNFIPIDSELILISYLPKNTLLTPLVFDLIISKFKPMSENLKDSSVLVVGSTGLLGMEICRQLTKAGKKVKALVRPSSDYKKVTALKEMGAEIGEGDLKNIQFNSQSDSGGRLCYFNSIFHILTSGGRFH